MNIMPLLTISWSEPSIIIAILAAILAALVVVVKISRWTGGVDVKLDIIDQKFDAIDKRFDKIDLKFEAIDRKFEAIDRKFEIIDQKFDRLHTEISDIKTLIGNALGLAPQKQPAGSQSPIQLNDFGEQISKDINGGELAYKYLNTVKYENGMSEYQIQQACFDCVYSDFMKKINAQDRETLERSAFKEGLPIQTILRVLGIELRNAKFKSLGIDIAGAGNGASEN